MTEAEFTAIYREHADKVTAGIYRIVLNSAVAEELMQESFLQFLKVSAEQSVKSVKGLLFQISHNLAVDYVRKNHRLTSGVDQSKAESKLYGESEMQYRVLRNEVFERLKMEDADLLRFYVLKVDYEMTVDEIAAELGVSRRTVFRIRDQLKIVLAEFL